MDKACEVWSGMGQNLSYIVGFVLGRARAGRGG